MYGIAVCAICSAKFGQEGTFRCAEHTPSIYEGRTTEAHESATVNRRESNQSNKVKEKENQPPNTQKSNSDTWMWKCQLMLDTTQSAKGDNEKKKSYKGAWIGVFSH